MSYPSLPSGATTLWGYIPYQVLAGKQGAPGAVGPAGPLAGNFKNSNVYGNASAILAADAANVNVGSFAPTDLLNIVSALNVVPYQTNVSDPVDLSITQQSVYDVIQALVPGGTQIGPFEVDSSAGPTGASVEVEGGLALAYGALQAVKAAAGLSLVGNVLSLTGAATALAVVNPDNQSSIYLDLAGGDGTEAEINLAPIGGTPSIILQSNGQTGKAFLQVGGKGDQGLTTIDAYNGLRVGGEGYGFDVNVPNSLTQFQASGLSVSTYLQPSGVYSIAYTDHPSTIYFITDLSSPVSVVLDASAVGVAGVWIVVQNTTSTTSNAITITDNTGRTFNGASSFVLSGAYAKTSFFTDGANWFY